MSTERYVDPSVGQALEEVQEALRTERRALVSLPAENAGLRAKLERLQAERGKLREELEGLRQGRTGRMRRLPEALTPPFELRIPVQLRRQLREAMPMLVMMLLFSSVMWSTGWWGRAFVLLAGLVGVSVQVLAIRRGSARWRFGEAGIEVSEEEVPGGLVRYSDIVDAEVHVTRYQRRRGVGTVEVRHRAIKEEEKTLTLKDVPEPDRLAAWLDSKRSDAV